MTRKRLSTSPWSSTADGSSRTSRRVSCESARAMLTICWAAGVRRPTSRVGEISLCPRRASRSAAARFVRPRWLIPAEDSSWPRKMFSATERPGTRSSSW